MIFQPMILEKKEGSNVTESYMVQSRQLFN